MTRTSFKTAIEALSARNAALASSYKEGARSLLSRSISSLAASMADQRRELGKELLALASLGAVGEEELDIEVEAASLVARPAAASGDVASLLERMRASEEEDYEILAALSGAVLPRSIEAAERLASLADQARKRASWAQAHIDLLGIS